MKSTTSGVGVVVVSYNSESELQNCIRSCNEAFAAAKVTGEVVVVDNNSKDDSVPIAKKAGAAVIANTKNGGFSFAVNQGLHRLLQDKSFDYFLILNPDALLSAKSLKAMLESFNADTKIGAVGPSMSDAKGESTNEGYYLKAPSWISVLLFSTFLRPFFIRHKWFVKTFYEESNLSGSRAVEQIPGACLLTSRAVLDDVGLLDEDFAIWYEDVEWCYRARKKGYKMWFCEEATLQHVGGVSFAKWQNLDKAVTFYVSMKTFFRKHKPVSYWLVLLALSLNSLVLYIKSRDRSNLVFLKRLLATKRGKLPD